MGAIFPLSSHAKVFHMLLQALRGFFRRVHLSALNQGQLTVMVALVDREQTCVEIAAETGFDREYTRQVLQRLRQQDDVVLRPYRASGHGQVEYIYSLTEKGSDVLKRCLGEFDGLMARLAVERVDEGNTRGRKSDSSQDLI